MATSPYRIPARPLPSPLRGEPTGSLEIAALAALVWLVALTRVGLALLRAEHPSGELDIAWLVLFLALVVIWKEFASRRSARSR